jgi:hypothetical protein
LRKLGLTYSSVAAKLGLIDISKGSRTLPIVDLDGDGKEELLWGEHCLGENGEDLWVIEKPYPGQPDIVAAADVLPSKPGLEVYYTREGLSNGEIDDRIGVLLADFQGQPLWSHWGYTHLNGGWVARLIPGIREMQAYASDVKKRKISKNGTSYIEVTHFLWDSKGELIGQPDYSNSIIVDWNGDGIHEICMPNGEVLGHDGAVYANLQAPCLWSADVFGDHREEIVTFSSGGSEVYIVFNTALLREPPQVTRLADRQVRNDLSRTATSVPNFVKE